MRIVAIACLLCGIAAAQIVCDNSSQPMIVAQVLSTTGATKGTMQPVCMVMLGFTFNPTANVPTIIASPGSRGLPGPTGTPGAPGATGPQGIPGIAGTMSVNPQICISASANGSTYTATCTPSLQGPSYSAHQILNWFPDVTNTGSETISVDTLPTVPLLDPFGNAIPIGNLKPILYTIWFDGLNFRIANTPGLLGGCIIGGPTNSDLTCNTFNTTKSGPGELILFDNSTPPNTITILSPATITQSYSLTLPNGPPPPGGQPQYSVDPNSASNWIGLWLPIPPVASVAK